MAADASVCESTYSSATTPDVGGLSSLERGGTASVDEPFRRMSICEDWSDDVSSLTSGHPGWSAGEQARQFCDVIPEFDLPMPSLGADSDVAQLEAALLLNVDGADHGESPSIPADVAVLFDSDSGLHVDLSFQRPISPNFYCTRIDGDGSDEQDGPLETSFPYGFSSSVSATWKHLRNGAGRPGLMGLGPSGRGALHLAEINALGTGVDPEELSSQDNTLPRMGRLQRAAPRLNMRSLSWSAQPPARPTSLKPIALRRRRSYSRSNSMTGDEEDRDSVDVEGDEETNTSTDEAGPETLCGFGGIDGVPGQAAAESPVNCPTNGSRSNTDVLPGSSRGRPAPPIKTPHGGRGHARKRPERSSPYSRPHGILTPPPSASGRSGNDDDSDDDDQSDDNDESDVSNGGRQGLLSEADRKNSHNEMERRRRSELKVEFARLSSLLPALSGEKAPKIAILNEANSYIDLLRVRLQAQQESVAELAKERDQLLRQIQISVRGH